MKDHKIGDYISVGDFRFEKMDVIRRERLHLAFLVQDDVQRPSRSNSSGIVLLHNFVLKADGLFAEFLNAGANDQ